jgi:hypothetical protein
MLEINTLPGRHLRQLTAQRREIEALKIRLAISEEAERRHSGAANEDLRVRA